ncbi:hypothetical protein KI387_020004, partial [Taxus chinensis]
QHTNNSTRIETKTLETLVSAEIDKKNLENLIQTLLFKLESRPTGVTETLDVRWLKMSVITSMVTKPPRWQHPTSNISKPAQNPLPPSATNLKFVPSVRCKCNLSRHEKDGEPSSTNPEWKNWKRCLTAAVAAVVIGTGMNAEADLNKYEAETRGEFGIGSAAQFGSADLRKSVHANENFRRANFTSADMRECDFSGSTFNGAYLEKAVAYKTNFTGADLSDTLMDRM